MGFAIAFFIGIGITLLGLLLVLLFGIGDHARNDADQGAVPPDLSAEAVLQSKRLGERICSLADLEFVSRETPTLRQQFVRERRKMACSWIAQRKRSARHVMALHRVAAGTNEALSPGLEFKLAANYFAFLAICNLAEILVRVHGPFASRKVIFGLVAAGERMKVLSDALLGRMQAVGHEAD